jgi:hypothetical protein
VCLDAAGVRPARLFLHLAAEKEDYASLSNDHYGLTVIHCDGRAEDSRPAGAPNNVEPSGALTALEGINNRVETARRALIGALCLWPTELLSRRSAAARSYWPWKSAAVAGLSGCA